MIPPDVPVHRPSVGAMRVTQGSLLPAEIKFTKPYVYRGTGEDQFPETAPPPPPPKPKAMTVSEYRKREVAAMKRRAKRRREERWAAEVHAFNRTYERFKSEVAPVFLDDLDIEKITVEPKPEPEPVPVRYRPAARPSRGWRPMTGDDLDSLLDEIG